MTKSDLASLARCHCHGYSAKSGLPGNTFAKNLSSVTENVSVAQVCCLHFLSRLAKNIAFPLPPPLSLSLSVRARVCACMPVGLSVSISLCFSLYVNVNLGLPISVCLFACPSFCLFIYLHIYLRQFPFLSISLSVCLFSSFQLGVISEHQCPTTDEIPFIWPQTPIYW